MIYLLAGHNNNDPGSSGVRGRFRFNSTHPYIHYEEVSINEATLTKELRDLVVKKLKLIQFLWRFPAVTIDDDNDSLKTVLKKINSTESDVICDLHFNASENKTATGVAVIHPEKPSEKESQLAKDIAEKLSSIMGLRNRGTMKPSETPRKTLGVMTKKGTNVLIEVCFISNVGDIAVYDINQDDVALAIADVLSLAHMPEVK